MNAKVSFFALMTINQRLMSIILRVIRLVSDGIGCEFQYNSQSNQGLHRFLHLTYIAVDTLSIEPNSNLLKDREKWKYTTSSSQVLIHSLLFFLLVFLQKFFIFSY